VGYKQVFKFSQRVRPNHIALVTVTSRPVNALVHEHVEVVKPEIVILLQLAARCRWRAKASPGASSPVTDARRIIHGEQDFFLLRRQAGKKLLAFPST